MVGCIEQGITSRDNEIPLYSAPARPQLEYSIQIWFPQAKKEVDRPETVKRTDTGMMKQLGSLSCKKGLRELRLLSLEK